MLGRPILFGIAIGSALLPVSAWAVCPTAVPIQAQLTCSSEYNDRISAATVSNLQDYTCGDPFDVLTQAEGEKAYSFFCQRSGTVTLQVDNLDCDIDIYVLGDSCSPSTDCVAGSTAASSVTDSVTFTCAAGQNYYIVIEGYGWSGGTLGSGACTGSEGNYRLSFDVSAGTGCPEDCDNGVDDDLDGKDDCEDPDCFGDPVCPCDLDNDGYDGSLGGGCAGNDCNDADPNRHPGAAEVADGVDNNCNSIVDEGTDWFDDDGDGWAEVAGDCDDNDASVFPGAPETCDNDDEDCDGVVDNGTTCRDDDGDGTSELFGDCNDEDPDVGPGATEILDNGIDDDCDGTVDDSAPDPDGDGYLPASGDCDPADGDVYPGAPELPDDIDNDCDGTVDEGTERYDDDDDGYTELDGDCDDDDDTRHPGAAEVANGVDDDCDSFVDEGTARVDDDGDGLSEEAGDCNDGDAGIAPGRPELPNGTDDDCDGVVDESGDDLDGDGWSVTAGDCDDNDGWANPDVPELCDGVDNNCDGTIDEGCDPVRSDSLGTLRQCGCDARGGAAGWLLVLPLLAALRRRRSA